MTTTSLHTVWHFSSLFGELWLFLLALCNSKWFRKICRNSLLSCGSLDWVDFSSRQDTVVCLTLLEEDTVKVGVVVDFAHITYKTSMVEILTVYTYCTVFVFPHTACALQFLHDRNISHLDLKPQNILLSGSVLKLAGDLMTLRYSHAQTHWFSCVLFVAHATFVDSLSLHWEK